MQTSRPATHYYDFTLRINEGFDLSHKLPMVEQMWRVAHADGKLADLLYIPKGAYVNAKVRAQATSG